MNEVSSSRDPELLTLLYKSVVCVVLCIVTLFSEHQLWKRISSCLQGNLIFFILIVNLICFKWYLYDTCILLMAYIISNGESCSPIILSHSNNVGFTRACSNSSLFVPPYGSWVTELPVESRLQSCQWKVLSSTKG